MEAYFKISEENIILRIIVASGPTEQAKRSKMNFMTSLILYIRMVIKKETRLFFWLISNITILL